MEAAKSLANKLANVTIVKKGRVDIITDGLEGVTCDWEGSLKRCGGIGDLLTGSIATFAHWTNAAAAAAAATEDRNPNILAAYNASVLIREASKRAFKKYYRSILAVDIIEQIPQSLFDLFESSQI